MTPKKEDYLKNILELGGDKQKVTSKDLGENLSISAASVSEMVQKLLKDGFVNHTPYQGIQLTKRGLEEASILVRKHRIWEVFLTEKLGFTYADVHEEAEELEHVTSERLLKKLEAFLDYPTHCPHGGMIPSEGQVVQEEEQQLLSDQMSGVTFLVTRLLDDKQLLDYLADKQIELNKIYHLKEKEAFEGTFILLDEDGNTLNISQKAAEKLFVVIHPNPNTASKS